MHGIFIMSKWAFFGATSLLHITIEEWCNEVSERMAEAESSDQVLCATQDISGLSHPTRSQSRRNVSISGYYFLQKNEKVSSSDE